MLIRKRIVDTAREFGRIYISYIIKYYKTIKTNTIFFHFYIGNELSHQTVIIDFFLETK